MPASTCGPLPINLHLPGANTVMGDIPVELPTSPSSLDVDHEQLTRTVHYIHEGEAITFEIVNKRTTLTELDSTVVEVDPISDNVFKRVLKVIFCSCVSRKIQRVKAKSFSTIGTV